MDLDTALAQLFSSKQKELIQKKSKGEKLTNTERQYYSRKVKKKLIAINNWDLQRLARMLMSI